MAQTENLTKKEQNPQSIYGSDYIVGHAVNYKERLFSLNTLMKKGIDSGE